MVASPMVKVQLCLLNNGERRVYLIQKRIYYWLYQQFKMTIYSKVVMLIETLQLKAKLEFGSN